MKEDEKFLNTDDIPESITGYSCPYCNETCSDLTLVSRTDSKFVEIPDPHYEWYEIHKCKKCETSYILHNAT